MCARFSSQASAGIYAVARSQLPLAQETTWPAKTDNSSSSSSRRRSRTGKSIVVVEVVVFCVTHQGQ